MLLLVKKISVVGVKHMKNRINLGAPIAWIGVVIYLIAALLIKDLFWSMIIIWVGMLTTLLGCYFWVVKEKQRGWWWMLLGFLGPFGLLVIWQLSPGQRTSQS